MSGETDLFLNPWTFAPDCPGYRQGRVTPRCSSYWFNFKPLLREKVEKIRRDKTQWSVFPSVDWLVNPLAGRSVVSVGCLISGGCRFM